MSVDKEFQVTYNLSTKVIYVTKTLFFTAVVFLSSCNSANNIPEAPKPSADLWQVYHDTLKTAKYVDLTHTITPVTPVWKGFGPSKFSPTIDPKTKKPYTYEKDGFEATHYDLSTDQLGTQLDPPAHWAPGISLDR